MSEQQQQTAAAKPNPNPDPDPNPVVSDFNKECGSMKAWLRKAKPAWGLLFVSEDEASMSVEITVHGHTLMIFLRVLTTSPPSTLSLTFFLSLLLSLTLSLNFRFT
jgi:hypothetical protein